MSRVYWDAMLFAYLFEASESYAERVGEIRANMRRRGDRLCTSTFALGELLVAPLRLGQTDVAARYRGFFTGPEVELLDFTVVAADRFAEIRAGSGVRPAAAIHLACASAAGVDLFLTNDRVLHDLVVPGIQFIGGLDVSVL